MCPNIFWDFYQILSDNGGNGGGLLNDVELFRVTNTRHDQKFLMMYLIKANLKHFS